MGCKARTRPHLDVNVAHHSIWERVDDFVTSQWVAVGLSIIGQKTT